MPEGYVDSEEENDKHQKSKSSFNGEEVDLSQVDITAPLRPDEIIPKIEHRIVSSKSNKKSLDIENSQSIDEIQVKEARINAKKKMKKEKKRKEKSNEALLDLSSFATNESTSKNEDVMDFLSNSPKKDVNGTRKNKKEKRKDKRNNQKPIAGVNDLINITDERIMSPLTFLETDIPSTNLSAMKGTNGTESRPSSTTLRFPLNKSKVLKGDYSIEVLKKPTGSTSFGVMPSVVTLKINVRLKNLSDKKLSDITLNLVNRPLTDGNHIINANDGNNDNNFMDNSSISLNELSNTTVSHPAFQVLRYDESLQPVLNNPCNLRFTSHAVLKTNETIRGSFTISLAYPQVPFSSTSKITSPTILAFLSFTNYQEPDLTALSLSMVENLRSDTNSNQSTANSMRGLTRIQGSFRLMVDSSILLYPGPIDINQLESYLSDCSKKWYDASVKIENTKKDSETVLNMLRTLMNAHIVQSQTLPGGNGVASTLYSRSVENEHVAILCKMFSKGSTSSLHIDVKSINERLATSVAREIEECGLF